MSGVIAVALLRFRGCLAARLHWLVAAVFLAALGVGAVVAAPSAADRAAQADRAVLVLTVVLAVLVAAVPAAVTLPLDVRKGRAHGLVASPATRFDIVFGDALGHGSFAAALALGMAFAGLAGLELSGLGSAAREPTRRYLAVDLPAERVLLSRDRPEATLRVPIPEGLEDGDRLHVRVRPKVFHQDGGYTLDETLRMGVGPLGAASLDRDVAFGVNVPFASELPLRGVSGGDVAELRVAGGTERWRIGFESLEVGGDARSFPLDVLLAIAALTPLLFVVAATALSGASRFGPPTACVLALSVVLLFGAQDILRDTAEFVVRSAETADSRADGHVHDDGHDHGAPSGVTSAGRVALARGVLGALSVVPPLETFDRSASLAERRGLGLSDVGAAFGAAVAPFAAALALAWLGFRRREMVPL